MGIRELKNIEYPIRLYRVIPRGDNRPEEPAQEVRKEAQTPEPGQPMAPVTSWTDAFLTRGGFIPLVIGLCLLSTPFGLFPFPQGGIAPFAGAVLTGIGLGRIWARRTGRRGCVLIALGAGIVLGAAFTHWRGFPNWALVVGGLIVIIRGVRSFAITEAPVSRSRARRERHGSPR